jgi:hypothetical protein
MWLRNIAQEAMLYCRKSAVILPEERGYIPGRVQLNRRKSAVIFKLKNSDHFVPQQCLMAADALCLDQSFM